jgi:hypothetical protein
MYPLAEVKRENAGNKGNAGGFTTQQIKSFFIDQTVNRLPLLNMLETAHLAYADLLGVRDPRTEQLAVLYRRALGMSHSTQLYHFRRFISSPDSTDVCYPTLSQTRSDGSESSTFGLSS